MKQIRRFTLIMAIIILAIAALNHTRAPMCDDDPTPRLCRD